MEIATGNGIIPGSVGFAQTHSLTKYPLRLEISLPPDLVQLSSTQPIRALVPRHTQDIDHPL